MIRLEIVLPISGLGPQQLEERRRAIQRHAGSRTTVRLDVLHDGPPSVETPEDEHVAGAAVVAHVDRRMREDGPGFADAVAVWCAGDPGVAPARRRSDVPVVGPGEASYHVARLAGRRFGVLCPLASSVDRAHELLAAVGADQWCAGVRSLDIPVLELREQPERTLERLEHEGRALVDAGARAVVLGCMGLFGMAEPAAARLGVPVVDPMAATVGVAELVAGVAGPVSINRPLASKET